MYQILDTKFNPELYTFMIEVNSVVMYLHACIHSIIMYIQDVPKQENSLDCGIFLCKVRCCHNLIRVYILIVIFVHAVCPFIYLKEWYPLSILR